MGLVSPKNPYFWVFGFLQCHLWGHGVKKIQFFAYLTNSMVFCTQLCTKTADITFINVIKLHLYVVPPLTRYCSIRVWRTIRFSLQFNKRLAPLRRFPQIEFLSQLHFLKELTNAKVSLKMDENCRIEFSIMGGSFQKVENKTPNWAH